MSQHNPREFLDNNNLQAVLNGNENRSNHSGMNSDLDGAIGDSSRDCDLEIIDIDSIDSIADEQTWLLPSNISGGNEDHQTFEEWIRCREQPSINSKKSLVNKLDVISKGSPVRFSSGSGSPYGVLPSPVAYLSRHNLSSTPVLKSQGVSSHFDSRTFSRSSANKLLLNRTFDFNDDATVDGILDSSPMKFNQTNYLKSPHLMNTTFEKEPSPGLRTNETFDSKSYFRLATPRDLNSTFDKDPSPGIFNSTFRKDDSPFNATFRKDDVNATFDVRSPNSTFNVRNASPGNATFEVRNASSSSSANSTFEVRNSQGGGSVNTTFEVRPSHGSAVNSTLEGRKLSEDRLSNASSTSILDHHRLSRDSSHDLLDEDRLSTTSESSISHRLNDVGDVQHIARMQEESLRQPIIQPSYRSATISPSSEHSANSPSTEGYMTGNNMGYQSEDGVDKHPVGGHGGHIYSSQDSLPDSPYSSQSLDVHPLSDQDRLRRSMPNLNKIRGHNNRGGLGGGSMGRGLGSQAQRPAYGALSKQHNSDPRLQAGLSKLRFQAPVPARGTTITTSREYLAPGRPGLQLPRQYGFAPPVSASNQGSLGMPQSAKTGIPRPGSRIPGPRTVSGIPKPGGGTYSQPGSRASSTGPRKMSADNYY